jgi:hypothetical protein
MEPSQRRKVRFTLLCNTAERQSIAAIAQHMNRSQGDAIRSLIRIAEQDMQCELESLEMEYGRIEDGDYD